jgi:hypothetical protein
VSEWKPSGQAPRDREVWLFLPSSQFKHDERGHPIPETVKHECVIAKWNPKHNEWQQRGTNRAIYPSMWNDADVSGPMPDNPMLG